MARRSARFSAKELTRILAQPGYAVLRQMPSGYAPGLAQGLGSGQKADLEARFLALWEEQGGPPLVREFRFHAARRWRADFLHEASRVLIEIEGGTRGRGRHTTHEGFTADAVKYNQAEMMGYKVFRLSSSLLVSEYIAALIAFVNKRAETDHL